MTTAASLLPALFIITLVPAQWRGLRSLSPWLVSAGTAVATTPLVGPGWAMLIGGGLGTTLNMALR